MADTRDIVAGDLSATALCTAFTRGTRLRQAVCIHKIRLLCAALLCAPRSPGRNQRVLPSPALRSLLESQAVKYGTSSHKFGRGVAQYRLAWSAVPGPWKGLLETGAFGRRHPIGCSIYNRKPLAITICRHDAGHSPVPG